MLFNVGNGVIFCKIAIRCGSKLCVLKFLFLDIVVESFCVFSFKFDLGAKNWPDKWQELITVGRFQ